MARSKRAGKNKEEEREGERGGKKLSIKQRVTNLAVN